MPYAPSGSNRNRSRRRRRGVDIQKEFMFTSTPLTLLEGCRLLIYSFLFSNDVSNYMYIG
jgi:hypothetical protein